MQNSELDKKIDFFTQFDEDLSLRTKRDGIDIPGYGKLRNFSEIDTNRDQTAIDARTIFDNIIAKPVDVVLTSVPWTGTAIPLMAVGILKNIVIESGKTCAGLDMNANVSGWIDNHPYKDKLVDFLHNEKYHPEIKDDLFNLYESFARKLLEHNPKIVGLSLLTYVCQTSARYICYFLKKINPSVIIIIGGTGCFENFVGHSYYADELLSSGLIDYYIRGDAEKSFRAFLDGNYDYPGINSSEWEGLTREELDTFAYPDYDDYNFDLYDLKAVPIIGSRGCVRACKFCDVVEYWKKFSYRSGQGIFNEMLAQNKKYGLRSFKFQDSLINGNLKEYKILIKLLADHNEKNPDNSFKWYSFFIFRPEGQFGEDLWELTAKSGAQWLSVGVESLTEHVRYHIGKHFSNEDMDFSLKMARKYNVKFIWLMIVGYVTETQPDIDFAAQWFRDHVEYRDLMKVQLGGTLGIFPNTWLDRNKEQMNIVTFGKPYQRWNNTKTGSTPEIRVGWQQHLTRVCKELGYTLFDDVDNHYVLELLMQGKQVKNV